MNQPKAPEPGALSDRMRALTFDDLASWADPTLLTRGQGYVNVASSHPQTALDIWRVLAEEPIGEVKPKSYQAAAEYLRKMRGVYEQQQRHADWQAFIASLRQRHKAKRRLLDILTRPSKP